MDAADLKVHESPRGGAEGGDMRGRGGSPGQLSFSQLGLRASRLKLPYYRDEDEGEEGGRRRRGEDEEDSGADADDEFSRLALCTLSHRTCQFSSLSLDNRITRDGSSQIMSVMFCVSPSI